MNTEILIPHFNENDYLVSCGKYQHIVHGENGDRVRSLLDFYHNGSDAAYLGMMGPNTYFNFRKADSQRVTEEPVMLPILEETYGLIDIEVPSGYIGVLPIPVDTRDLKYYAREHYHNARDYYWHYVKRKAAALELDQLCSRLNEVAPRYVKYFDTFLQDHFWFDSQCFILDLPHFKEFSSLLEDFFDGLRPYNRKTWRSPGNAFWRDEVMLLLLGVYVRACEGAGDSFFYTGVMHVSSTVEYVLPSPAFTENNVALFTLSSDFYVPYLGVWLQSCLDHFSESNNYDIVVMERGISEQNKVLLQRMVSGKKNVSLRFFNPMPALNYMDFYVSDAAYCMETYFRLFVPWLLPNYDRVAVIECDIILKADVAEFYQSELNGKAFGVCRHPVVCGEINQNEWEYDQYHNKIGLEDPFGYTNAGVLLMDLDRIRAKYSKEALLTSCLTHKFPCQDQDILNHFFFKDFQYLDASWNHCVILNSGRGESLNNAPDEYYQMYIKAGVAPKLLHYAAHPKPFEYPDVPYAYDFWEVARRTPFYELILYRMVHQINQTGEESQSQNHPAAEVLTQKKKSVQLSPIQMPVAMDSLHKQAVEKLRGIHCGQRCFFIGYGNSLSLDDLKCLKNEITFVAGNVFPLLKMTSWTPTYYCGFNLPKGFCDYRVLLEKLPFAGLEAAFLPYCEEAEKVADDKTILLPVAESLSYGQDAEPMYSRDCSRAVYHAYLPMYAMLQIAQYMGFSKVYFVGCDGKYDNYKPYLWSERNENNMTEEVAKDETERLKKGFRMISQKAAENGMDVFNATRGGNLSDFLRVSFDSLMRGYTREQ